MALKAKIELYETINTEADDITKGDVKVLQGDVKVLQDNDKKEEADKAAMLTAEIAILEAQLKELTMALNVFNPHPELFLGASEGEATAWANGVTDDGDFADVELTQANGFQIHDNGIAKEFSGMVT